MFDLGSLSTEVGLSAVLLIVLAIAKIYIIGTASKYLPLMAIAIGIILVPASLIITKGGAASAAEYAGAAVFGLIVGYSASGLREVVRSVSKDPSS